MPLSFQRLKARYEAEDCSIQELIDSLTSIEKSDLQAEVLAWPEDVLIETRRVLRKYFKLEVPTAFIKKALARDLCTCFEVYTDSVGDTYARDGLIECVLQEAGVTLQWPLMADSDKYVAEFIKQLSTKAPSQGIQLLFD